MSVSNFKLSFGKYAKSKLQDIPNDYLIYIVKNNTGLFEGIREKITEHLKLKGVSAEELRAVEPKAVGGEYVMTFGKHKSKRIKEIDPDYLKWCLSSDKIVDGIKKHILMHTGI